MKRSIDRSADGAGVSIQKPLCLFYSYSHRDKHLRDQLETHLAALQRQGLIQEWHDQQITAGADWEHEISEHLEAAHIILLLVSADFVASRYCYETEMARALQRHESGSARVIPIILRPCDWENSPLGRLQALPTSAKPITKWRIRDEAWMDVSRGLRKVIAELGVANGARLADCSTPVLRHARTAQLTPKEIALLQKFHQYDEAVRTQTGDRGEMQYICVDQATIVRLGRENVEVRPSVLNILLNEGLIRITDGSGSFSRGAGYFMVTDEGKELIKSSGSN